MTPEELSDEIDAAGLVEWREAILRSARPSIELEAKRATPMPVSVGRSKLGGDPDLPASVAWPTYDGGNLYFMAQVKLSELPSVAATQGLPPSGMLYFFYDMESQPWGFDPKDTSAHRVLYAESEERLERRNPPEAIEFDDGVRECYVKATPSISLPCWDSPVAPNVRDDAYLDLSSDTEHRHQLLGFPRQIQGAMELECQLASSGLYVGDSSGYQDPRAAELCEGASEWRLLFQMDSDDETMVDWGDVGSIYYWIREQDLAARQFDKTWLVLQCY